MIDIFDKGVQAKCKRASWRLFVCAVWRDEHIQRGKGARQLLLDVSAFLATNGFSCTDDDQIARLEVGLDGIVRRADDALCAVSLDRRADLFGDREAEAIDEHLLRIFLLESRGGKVAQDVDRNGLAYGARALPICLLIQMVFFDCNIFHLTPKTSAYQKPRCAKCGIGGFYVLSKILKN